jgi:A/G-specific adenine glycosylase
LSLLPETTQSLDERPEWVDAVRLALARWYDRDHRRQLPWREERDPYRVLLSEFMLVQTTTAAVAPHYQRFLERFPTLLDLAHASEADVLKAWEGLGYYRRARQLHSAARAIAQDHGGRVPDDPAALRRLPGVGPYIAGAVLSFAFNQRAPIVEANTQRVLARLLAWTQPIGSTATTRRLWLAASRLVPEQEPGQFNQALMDLGALLCTPATPRCLACPLNHLCQARLQGSQDQIPVKTPRPAVTPVQELAALVPDRGRWLMLQRGDEGLWAGFWEFPTLHLSGPDPANRSTPDAPTDPEASLLTLTGLPITIPPGPPAFSLTYGVTRYRVQVAVHLGELPARTDLPVPLPAQGFANAAWVAVRDMTALTRSAATRRIARHLTAPGGSLRSEPDDANV